ncbi:hypothetical protein BKA61DRAFT_594258 [Leptodontidium sp. MPI-SDFR-AT-0119]|nr:hypothetical protein BKA61DRAFT_594258 [Leptodontidium sp. MPI-SDFR-AT-0119]
MARQPKLRYFAYHDGHDPTYLRIGNLAFDYEHPKDHRPYYHEDSIDLFGSPPWATKDARTNCLIIHDYGCVRGFDIGASNLLSLGHSLDKKHLQVISGETGSMIELIDPHVFFEKVILESENAKNWLQTRLTVANDFSSRVKSSLKPKPKIWFLTGLYLMSNVSQRLVTTNTTSQNMALQIPVPDPSGVSALLQSNVGGSVSGISSESLGTGVEIKQEKVWAAQWQRVRVKMTVKEKWEATLRNQVRLLETFSLTTVRGSTPALMYEAAQLSLDDGDGDLESMEENLDEEYWAEFGEELNELETSLAMEQEDEEVV